MLKNILGLIIIATLFSCNNSSNNENKLENDSIPSSEKKMSTNTFYKLPSPVELYMFLNEEKAKYNNQLLNLPENSNKYITTTSKAINFGVYTSDLAYNNVYGENQQTIKYFSISKKIADELNLVEGFNEKTLKSIDKNINNKDSLLKIINDSYSDVVNLFQDQSKTKLLPLIVTGAWVESVYIAINSINKFSPENNIVLRIAEQQLLLENLLDYFKSLPSKDQNKEVFDKLLDLKTSYDKLYDNKNVVITKSQFDEISKKITALRLDFVNNKLNN